MTDFIDMDQPAEDFIAHHGVKGQKWGVRKARPTSSRSSKAKRSFITININKGSTAKKSQRRLAFLSELLKLRKSRSPKAFMTFPMMILMLESIVSNVNNSTSN